MGTCCGALATGLTRISASVVLIAGLGVLGYGLYLLSDDVNGLSIFVSSFGAYTAVVGAAGVAVSCMTTARCFTYVFVFLLSIALAAEMFFGIALKADKNWAENFFVGETCGTMNSTACVTNTREATNFFDNHSDNVFIVIICVVGVQCAAGLFACCFRSTHANYDRLDDDDDDEVYVSHGDVERGPPTASYFRAGTMQQQVVQTERQAERQANAQRLRDKYGLPGARSPAKGSDSR